MHGSVGLMSVEMQHAAAGQIEQRERVEIAIIAPAQYCALALVRAHEGERRPCDLPDMQLDVVFVRHVLKHAAEPVVRTGRDKIRPDAELGASERSGCSVVDV